MAWQFFLRNLKPIIGGMLTVKALKYASDVFSGTSLGKLVADKTGIWPIISTPRAHKIVQDAKNEQIKCKLHECQRSFQKIISVNSFEDAKKLLSIKHLNLKPIVAAKVGDRVAIKLEENINLEISGNPDLGKVNKELLGIQEAQDFEVSLIIAESHSFFSIKNCKSGYTLSLGAAPDPIGSVWCSEFHQRTDNTYIDKYYRGDEIWDGSRFVRDKASMSVTFKADVEQVKKIEQYLLKSLDDHPQGNGKYSFLGNNCHDHVQGALDAMFGGPKVKMMSMVNADEIDVGDKLVLYGFFDSLPTFQYYGIPQMLPGISQVLYLDGDALCYFLKPHLKDSGVAVHDKLASIPHTGTFLSTVVGEPVKWCTTDVPVLAPTYRWGRDYCRSRVDVNKLKQEDLDKSIDDDGNTLLHVLMQTHRYKDALLLLDKGANPDVVNKYKETPLQLLAADKYNNYEYYGWICGNWCDGEEDRYTLLDFLAEKTENIDQFDRIGDYTAFGSAVLNDDVRAMEILVRHGVDIAIKNQRGDSYVHIAQMSGKEEALQYLYDLNHKLFEEHNTIRQIPIHADSIKNFVDPDKHPGVEPLTNAQVYNKILTAEELHKHFVDLDACHA